MSIGGSFGANYSKSKQESFAEQYGTDVWKPQQGYLTDLWSQASRMAGTSNAGQQAYDQAGSQLGQAAQMLNYSGAMMGQAQGGLAQMAQPQGGVNPQLQAYSNQVGQMFNEQIMPALQGGAAQAGQLGSSRAQLGQAQAAASAQRNIQDFAGEQYQADMNRQLGALQSMQQGAAGMGQLGTSMANIGAGYGTLGQLQQAAPWFNLQQYAGALGAPIMQDLGGYSTAKGTSLGVGFNSSAQFGIR